MLRTDMSQGGGWSETILSSVEAHRFQVAPAFAALMSQPTTRAPSFANKCGSAAHAPARPGDYAHLAFESIAHSKVAST